MDQRTGSWTTLHTQRNPGRVAFMVANTDRQYAFGEVEQVLYQRPEIAEVAVPGTHDVQWGAAAAAVVALKTDAQLTGDELVRWARERLAGFKSPRDVKFADALPRTATGNVLKCELRKRWSGDGAPVQR